MLQLALILKKLNITLDSSIYRHVNYRQKDEFAKYFDILDVCLWRDVEAKQAKGVPDNIKYSSGELRALQIACPTFTQTRTIPIHRPARTADTRTGMVNCKVLIFRTKRLFFMTIHKKHCQFSHYIKHLIMSSIILKLLILVLFIVRTKKKSRGGHTLNLRKSLLYHV